jgi:hypothetical protein
LRRGVSIFSLLKYRAAIQSIYLTLERLKHLTCPEVNIILMRIVVK